MPSEATSKIPYASRFTRSKQSGRLNGWGVALLLLGAYLLLIALCTAWLRTSGIREGGGQLNFDRALFLSTSAATLTGFQQSIGFNDFSADSVKGPAILLILTVAGSLFAMIVAGLAAVRVLRSPFSDLQVMTAALIAEGLAVMAGAAILLSNGAGTFSDAFQQAASAFGNCGIVITSGKHHFPPFNSALAQLVLLPLSVLGGLGLPVLMDLYYRITGQIPRCSTHTRTVIVLSAAVYIAATLVLYAAARSRADELSGDADSAFMASHPDFDTSGRAAFLAASTAAIDTRTAGLPYIARRTGSETNTNVDLLEHFSPAAQWLLVVLMMIGANPAGTAGGLKATTFLVLFIGFNNVLRGRPVSRTFGIAGVWVGAYVLVAGVSFLTLSSLEPGMPAADGIFTTISALSNVGLNRGPIMIVGPGMFLLTVVMLLGRLMPLAVLWWMAATTRDAEVLVG